MAGTASWSAAASSACSPIRGRPTRRWPGSGGLKASCGIATQGAGKIPFICFDLAGGANMAGSNVLVGGQGGQLDFLRRRATASWACPAT